MSSHLHLVCACSSECEHWKKSSLSLCHMQTCVGCWERMRRTLSTCPCAASFTRLAGLVAAHCTPISSCIRFKKSPNGSEHGTQRQNDKHHVADLPTLISCSIQKFQNPSVVRNVEYARLRCTVLGLLNLIGRDLICDVDQQQTCKSEPVFLYYPRHWVRD